MNDGGPAFPHSSRSVGLGISETITDGGMSLRDWFAGQAIVGNLAAEAGFLARDEVHRCASNSGIAESAYALADAMLSARAKEAKP